MRYTALLLALGLMVATVSAVYADCPGQEQTASTDSSQAKLKQSRADRTS